MKRRHFLPLLPLLPLLLGGCATVLATSPPGEDASYALYSASYEKRYEMARIDTRTGFLNERHDVRALPPGAPGWSGGGPLQLGYNGHRVPERVWVSWRLPPRADQQRFEGDKVGPFEIKLRSLIPPEVLAELGDPKLNRRLEIALSVGVLPVRVRWQLVDTTKGQGLPRLRKGGDWRLPQPGE